MEGDRHTPALDLEEAAALAVAELPRQVSRAVSVIRAHKALLLQLPCDEVAAAIGHPSPRLARGG